MDEEHMSFQARGALGNATRLDNGTQMLIQNLVLENSLQVRTSTMVTAAFNTFAALVIIFTVMYDAWKSWKRDMSYRSAGRFDFLRTVHPAEVFPLVIAAAIVMQGFIVLGVQGIGLGSIFVGHCRAIAQIVWPTIWIVPETLLIFSVEVAIRGLKRSPFGPRGRWNTPICWVVLAIALILTWLPSNIRPARRDMCLGSLMWWAAPWSDIGVVLSSILIGLFVLTASVITFQLFRTVDIEREERIAASRVVYYLFVGIAVMAMVLPFFANIFNRNFHNTGDTNRLAAIAFNVFGIVIGLLHLILRSNAENMAIRPMSSGWSNNRGWRFFGSSDLDMSDHIAGPVVLERENSLKRLVGEKKSPLDPENGATEFQRYPQKAVNARPLSPPELSKIQPSLAPSSRKRSNYSLYPAQGSDRSRSPTSVYADDDGPLAPPRPSFFRRHRRDSSELSTATVQIGLRLSHSALTAVGHSGRDSVHRITSTATDHPGKSTTLPSSLRTELQRPSTGDSMELPIQMRIPTSNDESKNLLSPVSNTSMEREYTDLLSSLARKESQRKLDRAAKMKTLPPIPGTPLVLGETQEESDTQPNPQEGRSSEDQPSKEQGWPLRQPSGVLLPNAAYKPPSKDDGWI